VRIHAIVILGLALLLTGCATPPRDQAAAIADWASQQGGTIDDARVARVTAIGTALAQQAGCAPLRFHVLNTPSVAAYSWPSGDVFLTAGMVDQAADDEIAAAIAHELGHLLSDGYRHAAVALRGTDAPLDVEQRADRLGCQLLAATGRSPDAMVRALRKLCAASPSPECRGEIRARIAAIHQQFPD
jgi:Zn-dependent protease with chaperone function